MGGENDNEYQGPGHRTPVRVEGVNAGLDQDDARDREILLIREKERELEKERPCIFKSISPVS